MLISRWYTYCIAAALVVLLAGCGNSNKPKGQGKSLSQRYAAAQKLDDPESRARELLSIAAAQEKAKDSSGAKKSLRDAARAAREIPDAATKSNLFTRAALGSAKLGHRKEEKESLAAAKQAIAMIESPVSRASALGALAEVEGYRSENRAAAAATLKTAEQLAASVESPGAKVDVLTRLAASYGKIDDTAEGGRLVQTAIELAQSSQEADDRAAALAVVAGAQVSLKDKAGAAETLGLATAAAEEIENVYRRVYVMMEIAKQLDAAGKNSDAQKLLKQADTLTDEIPQPDLQMEARTKVRKLRDEL